MIDCVVVRALKNRGWLMEVLRKDWQDVFAGFGQAYVSLNYPGVDRAWHYYKRQNDLFICLACMIKGRARARPDHHHHLRLEHCALPLYDARDASSTKGKVVAFFIGEDNPLAISIPPGAYHGYKTVGQKPPRCS